MIKKDKNYQNLTFVTISKIPAIYGISRATVYRWLSTQKLPKPTRITSRIVGWKRSVLDEIFLGEKS